MISYKKFPPTLSILLFLSISINAQTVIGKYAGELLAIGVGGRALGMGGAHTAVANDVTAGYWNPAGLASLDYPQVALMHEEHFGNLVNYNYAGVAIPYGTDYSIGLSVMRLSVDAIPDTREALIDRNTGSIIYNIYNPAALIDPSKVKEFNNTDWAFYLTFATRYYDDLDLGVNVKVIQRNIAEYTATGIGFDIGAVYHMSDKLLLGANIQDVTTTLVAWSTGRNELISPTAKIGAAYKLEFLGGIITPAMDLDLRFEGREFASMFNIGPISFDLHTGLEYDYNDLFMVRGGYNDVKQFTVGAGIKLPKLNIDYSFARQTDSEINRLPDTHRISLILTLEQDKYKRD
ncbi:MAG: PorV/PorQ family protein [Melioribacteraceae bacterium]|nr:PorV/PorQ family protein [Melioribacteraceae bacterium]MCF8430812.1 PorV/PorQ family protein [Melioribacteraceae bacterium]